MDVEVEPNIILDLKPGWISQHEYLLDLLAHML